GAAPRARRAARGLVIAGGVPTGPPGGTPMKPAVALLIAALAFGAGFFLGEMRGGIAGRAIDERLDTIDTRLAAIETARPAAPARADVRTLSPEEAMKVIDVKGAPVRGNPNAPVTIVEYGDFQCPYCKASRPTLKKILEAYPQQVKVLYKHFPLSFHR